MKTEYTINAKTLNPNTKGTASLWLDPDKVQPKIDGVTYLQPEDANPHPEQKRVRYGSGGVTPDLIAQMLGAESVDELPRKENQEQTFSLGYRPAEEPLIACEYKRGGKTLRNWIRGHRRAAAAEQIKAENPELWAAAYPHGLPVRVMKGKPTDPHILAMFRDHGQDRRRDLFIVERLDLVLMLAGQLVSNPPKGSGIEAEKWPESIEDQLLMIRGITQRTKADGITLGMIREYVRDNSALTSKQQFDDVIRYAHLPVKDYEAGRENAEKGIEKPTPKQVKALYKAAQEHTAERQKVQAEKDAETTAKKADASPTEVAEAKRKARESIKGNKIDRPSLADFSKVDKDRRTAIYNPGPSGTGPSPASPDKLKRLADSIAHEAKDAGRAKTAKALVCLIQQLAEPYNPNQVGEYVSMVLGRLPEDSAK